MIFKTPVSWTLKRCNDETPIKPDFYKREDFKFQFHHLGTTPDPEREMNLSEA